LKNGVKNKFFIPYIREFYDLSKFIRFAIIRAFINAQSQTTNNNTVNHNITNSVKNTL